jgi:hypothetical protein
MAHDLTLHSDLTYVRRVVTGHDTTGKAVVVEDVLVQPTTPDFGQKWSIYGADSPPRLPNDGGAPPFAGPLLPRPGGLHIVVFTLPARFNPDTLFQSADGAAAAQAAREHTHAKGDTHPVVADPNPPGSYGSLPGASGMHATASIDCLMQVSGESFLVLEDSEVRLRPGDWLIVNGVMHSWRNDLDQDSVLIGVVYGAPHEGAPIRRR